MNLRILALAIAVVTGSIHGAPADFSGVPGVVVDHAPVSTKMYLPTSSIIIASNGTYLVAHDYASFDHTTSPNVVKIFESANRGRTWSKISEVTGRWDTLFEHRGALYLFGPLRMYGPAMIRRSLDGGRTWTEPTDAAAGLLDARAPYHSSAVPVVVHRGRVWRAFEQTASGPNSRPGWTAVVFSAPAVSDLLNAANWTISEPIHHHGAFKEWIEGNVVVAPSGEIVDFIRTNGKDDTTAIIHVSPDGRKLSHDPAKDVIDFPGGGSKFTIRFDEKSERYWSLANKQTNPAAKRNILVLTASPDLRRWDVVSTVLSHPDAAKVGFHYVDWVVDGNDIIFTSRTAYPDGMGGPKDFHDNNFITFHRIKDFRLARRR